MAYPNKALLPMDMDNLPDSKKAGWGVFVRFIKGKPVVLLG